MATREEIREGIADNLDEWMPHNIGLLVTLAIMKTQNSQDVVRKVEGELPIVTKKGWYYLVEPLIKE